MRHGIINIKEAQNRFDASYYMSEGRQTRAMINSSPYAKLRIGDVADKIFYGIRANRIYVTNKNHAIPFMTGANIMLSETNKNKLVSKKHTPCIEEMTLHPGWVLITRSGTVGQTAWSNKLFEGKYGSEDIIRIIPNGKIKGGLMYAYLASKYGNVLLTQGSFGAVIQHIEPNFVADINIPNFPESFQQKVDELIQESARLREEAAEALEEAKKEIESLFPIINRNKYGSISSIEIFTSLGKRFEASFHQSNAKMYDEYIKQNFDWKPLSELAFVSRPDLFKRNYVKNGLMFLGGKDIFLSVPKSDKFISRKNQSNIQSLVLKEGDILMPRSGTIGEVAFATSQHAQKLASEHVIRISADNILRAGYLYAFLSSTVGKTLIQRYIFGSVIQHVEPHQLNHIPIPLINEKKMEFISHLANTNKEKLGKAGELELKAIQMVEDEIESWK